jgi:hypothetical protein
MGFEPISMKEATEKGYGDIAEMENVHREMTKKLSKRYALMNEEERYNLFSELIDFVLKNQGKGGNYNEGVVGAYEDFLKEHKIKY